MATESPEYPPSKLFDVPEGPNYKRNVALKKYDSSLRNNKDIALVIDPGSWELRAGFSTDLDPRFTCTPLVARYRDRKALKTYTICGNDVYADPAAKSQAKSPFDSNVISNFDVFELLLDYTFLKLGIDANNGMGHHIVMTEPVCNPGYCRRTISEMLFEGYNAQSVTYGIDALFSYDYNNGTNGLVISSSNTATHLIPVLNRKGILSSSTRLNWGGSQSVDYLLKLIQLKYPSFPGKLNNWQAEALMLQHCYISGDYRSETATYLDRDVLSEKDRVIQFPFTETIIPQKTEEELARIAERKKESGRRLQEQAAKMRLEKLIKKEQDLESLRKLQSKVQAENKTNAKKLLGDAGFKDENQLERSIKELDRSIKRSRKQDVGEDDEEPPTFPLLDIPDEELDAEQVKQKRQQRLLKSNYEARARAKAEKEAEKARIAEGERKDLESRTMDLEGWIREKRARRDALMTKIKDRERLKSELSNRKSLASQLRMKSIANLASDTPTTSKKRRRGGAGGANGGDDDTFGADDDDWAVYRNITRDGNQSEDDEEEELNTSLKALEAQLLEHDPTFEIHHTLEAQSQKDWRTSKIHAFLRGVHRYDSESQKEQHQIHLNMERIRVPEVVFQPTMAGIDQAGIIEIASDIILHRVSNPEDRDKILRDVFLTGGNVQFKGFGERVKTELRTVLPYEAPLGVRTAKDPLKDAWRGASQWCREGQRNLEWTRARVTREEWEEKGGEYIKEHRLGNAFV